MEDYHPRYKKFLTNPLRPTYVVYRERNEERARTFAAPPSKEEFIRATDGLWDEVRFAPRTWLAQTLGPSERIMWYRRPLNTTKQYGWDPPFDVDDVFTLIGRETRLVGPRIRVLEYHVNGRAATGYIVVQLEDGGTLGLRGRDGRTRQPQVPRRKRVRAAIPEKGGAAPVTSR